MGEMAEPLGGVDGDPLVTAALFLSEKQNVGYFLYRKIPGVFYSGQAKKLSVGAVTL